MCIRDRFVHLAEDQGRLFNDPRLGHLSLIHILYETDFDKRVELFQELELLVSREIPIIVIANQSSYSMYRKDVYDGWMKTYAYQQAEQNRLSYMAR